MPATEDKIAVGLCLHVSRPTTDDISVIASPQTNDREGIPAATDHPKEIHACLLRWRQSY